jgi:hypothetical protein
MNRRVVSVVLFSLIFTGCYFGGSASCYTLPVANLNINRTSLAVGETLSMSVTVPVSSYQNCPGVRGVTVLAGQTIVATGNSAPFSATWNPKAGEQGIPSIGNVDVALYVRLQFAGTPDTTLSGPQFVEVRTP